MPASDIARHVPYLRRYARALTGSQPQGDAAVQAMFEALLADRLALEIDIPIKVSLFQAFHASYAVGTWVVPDLRTTPNGMDNLIIEPGNPGDGAAADIASIRIDMRGSAPST